MVPLPSHSASFLLTPTPGGREGQWETSRGFDSYLRWDTPLLQLEQHWQLKMTVRSLYYPRLVRKVVGCSELSFHPGVGGEAPPLTNSQTVKTKVKSLCESTPGVVPGPAHLLQTQESSAKVGEGRRAGLGQLRTVPAQSRNSSVNE